jgi:predicted amidohydrolase
VNRSGEEEGMKYFSNSLIVDTSGNIIARGGFEESVVTATVNLGDVEQGRKRRFYMRDRRPEIYSRPVEP